MNSNKLQTTPTNTSKDSAKTSKSSAAKAASVLPFADVSAIKTPSTPKAAKPSGTGTSGSGMSTRERPEVVLPQTKVKLIMKTSPQVENIGHDALYLIAKSTELFIDYMTSTAFANAKSKTLEYKHLAELAQSDERMEFLKEIVPRKVPARIALQEMAKQKALMDSELLQ